VSYREMRLPAVEAGERNDGSIHPKPLPFKRPIFWRSKKKHGGKGNSNRALMGTVRGYTPPGTPSCVVYWFRCHAAIVRVLDEEQTVPQPPNPSNFFLQIPPPQLLDQGLSGWSKTNKKAKITKKAKCWTTTRRENKEGGKGSRDVWGSDM